MLIQIPTYMNIINILQSVVKSPKPHQFLRKTDIILSTVQPTTSASCPSQRKPVKLAHLNPGKMVGRTCLLCRDLVSVITSVECFAVVCMCQLLTAIYCVLSNLSIVGRPVCRSCCCQPSSGDVSLSRPNASKRCHFCSICTAQHVGTMIFHPFFLLSLVDNGIPSCSVVVSLLTASSVYCLLAKFLVLMNSRTRNVSF